MRTTFVMDSRPCLHPFPPLGRRAICGLVVVVPACLPTSARYLASEGVRKAATERARLLIRCLSSRWKQLHTL